MINAVTKRLHDAVIRSGGNKAVALKAGVPLSSLNTYLAGKDMKGLTALKIARACGVSLNWFYEGEESGGNVQRLHGFDVATIPFFTVDSLAEFRPSESQRSPIENCQISRNLLDKLSLEASSTIMLKIDGDSMRPTLNPGDLTLVDTRPSKNLYGVTVLLSEGQTLVKRMEPLPSGKVALLSDNKLYPAHEVEAFKLKWGASKGKEAISIIGRISYRFQEI